MHTVVVGAGVIGLTTAYHLAREGEEVTILDARASGQGASEVNAGWIVPAEAAPVPGPGMVAKSLRWMLRPDSPLYIRPSLDPQFAKFMIGMWRRSNAHDQRAGFEAHLRLAEGSVETFDEYRHDGVEFEMHRTGLLMAFIDDENLRHHVRLIDLPARHGLDPRVLRGDEVRAQEPMLSDAVRGGIYFPLERHVDPGALVRGLRKRIDDMGVRVVEHAAVARVHTVGERVQAVESVSARHEADRFVLAAGAWTGPVSKLFGAPLPIRPGKGYSIDVGPFPLRSAVNLSDAKVAVTPLHDRLRLAGTMEFGGLDEDINEVRVAAILRAPERYLRDWTAPTRRIAPRAGMRPMSPDGLPLIGRLGDLTNTYVSTGHGMLGVTLAPGSAAALTRLIRDGTLPEALKPFSPSRFRTGRALRRAR